MDSGLYSRWATGGHLGSYASYNNNEYTVYYDPASPLRLDGIVLDTMEKHAIDMEFTMRNGVPVRAPFASQTFHFRQLVDTTTADSVYGCVSFTLGIEQDDTLIRRGALVVTEAGQGAHNDCQYIEMIAANCGTNMGKEVDLRGWIINDNAGWYGSGQCNATGVHPGHLRLSDEDVWAAVPVGNILVLYNNNRNCYGRQAGFEYNSNSGVYWTPIDTTGGAHILQYTADENNDVCTYCSDTGTTVYDTARTWKTNVLDGIADVAQTVCPGCSTDIPVLPALYSGVAYQTGQVHEFLYASDTSVGLMTLINNNTNGRFKYVYTGNSDEEYADTGKWDIEPADTLGAIPPTLGVVSGPFREQVIAHETNFPCCAGPTQRETMAERKTPAKDKKKNANASYMVRTIKVYPNPANTTVHFEFPFAEEMTIAIVDVTGKELSRQVVHNTSKAAFDVRQYAPGLYLYQAIAGNNRYVGKVIVNK